jgi:hypothetical protein
VVDRWWAAQPVTDRFGVWVVELVEDIDGVSPGVAGGLHRDCRTCDNRHVDSVHGP